MAPRAIAADASFVLTGAFYPEMRSVARFAAYNGRVDRDDNDQGMLRLIHLLRWPAVVVVVVLLGWLAVDRALRFGRDAVVTSADRAAATMRDLAAGFRSTTITETFTAAIPRLGTEGMLLEVATLEATEIFERRDEKRTLFEFVPLGTTVSEIRVPVTYRYHVRLEDPWRLDVSDGVCRVRAPPIRATQPPAFHTGGVEKRIEGSWLRFDEDEVMEELERSLSDRLSARAASPDTIDLVRETCRRHVAEFVREWLLAEDQWGDGRIVAVDVVFADEVDEKTENVALPPELAD